MTSEQEQEVGRCIFREANDAFLILDPSDQRVLDANPSAQRLTGLRRKQILGSTLPELLEAVPPRDLGELVKATQVTGYFAPADGYLVRSPSGKRRAVHASASRIHTEAGPLGLVVLRDISHQRQAEDALRESEHRLRLALDASHMGTWEWNPGTGRVSWSETTYRLFRLGRDDFAGTYDAFLTLVHPEDRERVRREVMRLRETGGEFNFEHRIHWPDGTLRWLAGHGVAVRGAAGRPERVIGVVQDVTERKEAAALENERRFRALVENSSDAVLLLDAEGTVLYASPSVVRVRGFTAEELEGRSAFALVHPDDLPRLRREYARVLASPGQSLEVKGRLRHKDGSWRLLEGVGTNLLADPLIGAVVINYRDVTERERAVEALRDSEALYASLVESLPLNLFRKDRDGRFTFANGRFCQTWGRTLGQILGKTDFDLSPPDLAEKYRRDDRKVLETGAALEAVEELQAPGGERTYVQIWKTAVKNARAEIIGVQGIFWDITERKRAEEERRRFEARLQQAQKLETLGVLAGGIAHDFNNLLTGILGYASLGLTKLPPESPAHELVRQIEKAALRAADLTSQMLAYSGRGRFVVRRIGLSGVVEEMAGLLQTVVSKKALLRFELAPGLPDIDADPAQVRQVVMNLLTNASEAIGDKSGAIAVRTGLMAADRAYLGVAHADEDVPEGDYVYLEVADTGCGMDAATMARVFDPFYSTKFVGRGLGLAAVRGIVRGHRGAVRIASEPGKGTTFRVLFPCGAEPTPGPAADIAGEAAWRGAGTVLVIDDEDTVRAPARRVLEQAGFRVLEAADGREGLNAFRTHGPEVVAVLLDLTMPFMSGEEVFAELRRLQPDVRVILTSGYSAQEVTNLFAGKGLAGFVHKPFRAADLLAAVRQALERDAGEPATPPP